MTEDFTVPVRVYTGKEILTLSEDKIEPLIEDILYENDYIMLVGDPKTNKSILAMQMTCALTTGTPFLGIFDVPKPVNVWYFATEGKDQDIKDRFIRMEHAVGLDDSLLHLFCSVGLTLNGKMSNSYIDRLVELYGHALPKVIIIDALYMAFEGSLTKDEAVATFHRTVKRFAERCDAAVIIVHHLTKDQTTPEGKVIVKSDKAAYGSVFLMGSVDHCFMIEKWLKKEEIGGKTKTFPLDRYLRCDTQRSGHISGGIRLRLIEPDPLFLLVISKHEAEKHELLKLLRRHKRPLTATEIIKKLEIARATFYMIVRELLLEGHVEKTGAKVKYFGVVEEAHPNPHLDP